MSISQTFYIRMQPIYSSVLDKTVKSGKMLVAQSCPTLCESMDWSPPGSSVDGILLARILEWVAIPFSRGSSLSRDWTQVSCIADRIFTIWATREARLPKEEGFSKETIIPKPCVPSWLVSHGTSGTCLLATHPLPRRGAWDWCRKWEELEMSKTHAKSLNRAHQGHLLFHRKPRHLRIHHDFARWF